MDFLGAVNRALVNNTIIKGDDDLITSFGDMQHEATIRFARNAITSELNNLSSIFSFPRERTLGSITSVNGQRVYTLPVDFVQFWGRDPFMYLDTDASQRVFEWRGGEEAIRKSDYLYLTNSGYEQWWYWFDALEKSVGLYQVPDTDGRIWRFDYEKSVGVINESDSIPFQTEQESEAFADMAARRAKYLMNELLDISDLEQDAEYKFARGTLFNLIRNKNANPKYGRSYL